MLPNDVQVYSCFRLVLFGRYKFSIRQVQILYSAGSNSLFGRDLIYSPRDYIGFGLSSFISNTYNVVFRTRYYF